MSELANSVAADTFTPAIDSREGGPDAVEALTPLLVRGRNADRRVWTSEALCKGKTHLFFAPVGERRTRRNRREAVAKAYCDLCPVADECRAAARENRESGFWGGENEEQRAREGFGPRSPNRRAVADAARIARTKE